MKTYWGSGGIAARILDLGTRWRSVVSFTPRPLYSQGKSPDIIIIIIIIIIIYGNVKGIQCRTVRIKTMTNEERKIDDGAFR
jgi:hypothetical protein